MEPGKFIVIEGLDGAGTTTQAKLLANYLFEKGKKYVPVLTREPTELTVHGQELRRRLSGNLLSGEEVIHDPTYWTRLFVEDRAMHLKQVVQPNIEKGLHVISDRHMLSTLAYQSAQGGDMKMLLQMHHGFYTPDLTLFLRVPAPVALKRVGARREKADYFEQQQFLQSVEQEYEKAIQLAGAGQRVVIIDGTLPLEKVSQAIQEEVEKIL